VATPWLDRRIQMRIDHHALFRPLTKGSVPLRKGQVAGALASALALARAEPPGPVHLDLPEDVGDASESLQAGPVAETLPSLPDVSERVAAEVSRLLAASRHPLLVTGLSFTRSACSGELLRFIERQGIPFVTTLHAKGFLPERHPNWCGVLGRARRTDVQAFVKRADCIIAVGYDPIEMNYEEWTGGTPVVHLSTEPAEAGPSVHLVLDAAGDMNRAVDALAELPRMANDWSPTDFEAHRAALDRALRPDCDGLAPPRFRRDPRGAAR
jgi:acetolactate synthase-1/2/3 large subunit